MCDDKKLADNQFEMSSLAFEILPAEIWDKIFKYLKGSPSDLAACMNTCGQWYNLLKSQRTTVLFPAVFKILAESKEVNWYRTSKNDRYDEDDVNERLTRTRLFGCRLVSKAWNDAIISFIQWHPTNFQLEEFPHTYQHTWQRDLYNRSVMKHILKKVGTTYDIDKNPFVTRSVSINFLDLHLHEEEINEVDDQPIFYRLVTRVLEMFGDHLWHFHVDDVSFYLAISNSFYYALLQTWLSLMPNLKTLRIYYKDPLNNDEANHFRLQMPIPNMMALQNRIEATPLPVLKNLTVLDICNVTPPLALGLLGKCGDSLERLGIEGRIVKLFPEPFSTLPEMKCLKMVFIKLENETELLALEKAFVSQECANLWPLESLFFAYKDAQVLQNDRDVFGFGSSWDSLFRFVNLFKDTLTELCVELPQVYNDFEKHKIYRQSSKLLFKLQLPNLKKLKLTLWNHVSFDFLLPLKKLEELEICKPDRKEHVPPLAISKMKRLRSGRKIWVQRKPSNVIQSHGWYMTRMSHSNIWQKLPCLRVLKIETDNPWQPYDCYTGIRQVYRVVKRDENGQVKVVKRDKFVIEC